MLELPHQEWKALEYEGRNQIIFFSYHFMHVPAALHSKTKKKKKKKEKTNQTNKQKKKPKQTQTEKKQ